MPVVNPIESTFNRIYGFLVARGLMPNHNRVLSVPGRRSGKLYTTPVYVLEFASSSYLVAPRGETQWALNARAAGEVRLSAGRDAETVRVREVADNAKAAILQAYLLRFEKAVQRFFEVRADADIAQFESIAAVHPVFELLREDRPHISSAE